MSHSGAGRAHRGQSHSSKEEWEEIPRGDEALHFQNQSQIHTNSHVPGRSYPDPSRRTGRTVSNVPYPGQYTDSTGTEESYHYDAGGLTLESLGTTVSSACSYVRGWMPGDSSKKEKLKRRVEELENLTSKYSHDIDMLKDENVTLKRVMEEMGRELEYHKKDARDAKAWLENTIQQARTDKERIRKETAEKMEQFEKTWRRKVLEKDDDIKLLMNKMTINQNEISDLKTRIILYETMEEEKKSLEKSLIAKKKKLEEIEQENSRFKLKIVDLEIQISRASSDGRINTLENTNMRNEIERLQMELNNERDKAVNTHGETAKQCDVLMHKKYQEFENEKENIRKELHKRIEELNRSVKKQIDDKFRMREEHSNEISALAAENRELIDRIRSNHEKALKEKNQEIQKVFQDLLKVQQECSEEIEKVKFIMNENAERSRCRYEEAMKNNNHEASEFINLMYQEFKDVAEKHNERLKEAKKRERVWKERFMSVIEQSDGSPAPGAQENDEDSGVQIEEVLD